MEKADLFLLYNTNRLSLEEKTKLEQQLENDPAIRQDYEIYQLIGQALKYEKEKAAFKEWIKQMPSTAVVEDREAKIYALEQQPTSKTNPARAKNTPFSNYRNTNTSSTSTRATSSFRWWAVAASISFFTIVGFCLWTLLPQHDYIVLYERHYETPSITPALEQVIIPKNNTATHQIDKVNISKVKRQALEHFQEKRWAEAEKLLLEYKKIASLGDNYFYTLMYLGISQLEQNKDKAAIQNLELAAASIKNQELNKIDAQWYLALAYVKSKRINKAVPILRKLSHHPLDVRLATKAQNLLKDLK